MYNSNAHVTCTCNTHMNCVYYSWPYNVCTCTCTCITDPVLSHTVLSVEGIDMLVHVCLNSLDQVLVVETPVVGAENK